MILLDTHVLIWMDEGNMSLGNKAIELINHALLAGELAVSAISFWEVAMLLQKQRLAMQLEVDIWRKELLENGLLEISLDGATGIRAGGLQKFHGDPADRLIVATALDNSATLLTADEKILTWDKRLRTIDARI
ncbi:MAG: twitching motility protein PilT [Deltaproteobacteria bacterium RIFOXYD12_FULL_57_12]|nr:MAG: twitching motility protein PilT [Deltaproteobacteria bacterium RIFOXYD12_FULL_57_12]